MIYICSARGDSSYAAVVVDSSCRNTGVCVCVCVRVNKILLQKTRPWGVLA